MVHARYPDKGEDGWTDGRTDGRTDGWCHAASGHQRVKGCRKPGLLLVVTTLR